MAPLIYTLYGFAIFFFIYWCSMWILQVASILYGKWKFHRKLLPSPRETPLPGVSILKPLLGVDPNLFSNLETFFTMNYPKYELLFCVHDECDPATMLVNKLLERYPTIDAKVFVGGKSLGINPKINNMQPGYEAAKYDLLLVSDSGIRMKEDTLYDMVFHMTDDTGLVHQMPFTCDRKGFPAVLEKVYFGTAHARMYLSAELFGFICATGMSALMRKHVLDEVGGIKAFVSYLAEDYFFSKEIAKKGWKIKISSQPAWQNSGLCEVSSFQDRLSRWTKLRIAMLPHTILLEPLTECMVNGALAAWAANLLFGWDSIVFYLVHILVWFLLDWVLLSVVQNGSLQFSKFDFVIAWLVREVCAPYLFSRAMWDPNIQWRTGTYRLKWGGIAEVIKPKH